MRKRSKHWFSHEDDITIDKDGRVVAPEYAQVEPILTEVLGVIKTYRIWKTTQPTPQPGESEEDCRARIAAYEKKAALRRDLLRQLLEQTKGILPKEHERRARNAVNKYAKIDNVPEI